MRYLLLFLMLLPVSAYAFGFGSVMGVGEGGGATPEYIIGYNTDDLTGTSNATDRSLGNAQPTTMTDSTGGTLTKICVRVEAVGVDPGIRMAVYVGGSYGNPSGQDLVEAVVGTASVGVVCIDTAGTETLLPDQLYWVGIVLESSNTEIGYTDGTATDDRVYRVVGVTYATGFAATCPTSGLNNNSNIGVWAVYEH